MVSDILDRVAQFEQEERDRALENHRNRVKAGPQPKGFCHYCDEAIDHDKVFCDTYCRDDYEYEQKRKIANGRI